MPFKRLTFWCNISLSDVINKRNVTVEYDECVHTISLQQKGVYYLFNGYYVTPEGYTIRFNVDWQGFEFNNGLFKEIPIAISDLLASEPVKVTLPSGENVVLEYEIREGMKLDYIHIVIPDEGLPYQGTEAGDVTFFLKPYVSESCI